MLQQTQVTTVIPYFERFMQRFPQVTALAAAEQDEVLHLWTGLGYYARARNLHKTAQIVTEQYNGEFPDSQAALEALPGIGRSTAGAILAIAYQQQATILDGNVKRVLARYKGIDGWPGETRVAKIFWQVAEALTPAERVADYTQAIMDLGATLCSRSKPNCDACPFNQDCVAFNTQQVEAYPAKKPKKTLPVRTTTMLLIENQAGELMLQKRPNSGLWGGLWSFPECEADDIAATLDALGIAPEEISTLTGFRHTFTHFHLDISPVHVKCTISPGAIQDANQRCWYSLDNPAEIGLTRPVTKLLNQLRST